MSELQDVQNINMLSSCLDTETEFITGPWLKRLRKELNISQETMANHLFGGVIGRETLTRYENGTFKIGLSNRVIIAFCLKNRLGKVFLKPQANQGRRSKWKLLDRKT
jgi:transcriptional regulator with XRE-family HTH domain